MIELATRKLLVSDEVIERLAADAGCEITWGEPDADGFYTPTLTRTGSSTERVIADLRRLLDKHSRLRHQAFHPGSYEHCAIDLCADARGLA